MRILASIVLALGLVGCTHTPTPLPGSLNPFDSNAFVTLNSAQAAIEQAKVDIAKFPQFKTTLNSVIAGYNTAEDAYIAYHQTVAAGKTADQTALANQIAQLMSDIGALQKSIAGVKQ